MLVVVGPSLPTKVSMQDMMAMITKGAGFGKDSSICHFVNLCCLTECSANAVLQLMKNSLDGIGIGVGFLWECKAKMLMMMA